MNRPLHDQLYLCYLPVPFYFSLSLLDLLALSCVDSLAL